MTLSQEHLEKKKKLLTAIHVMLFINGRPSSPSQIYSIYSRGVVINIAKSVILTLTRRFHIVWTFGNLNKYLINSQLKSQNLIAALSIHYKQHI